MEDVLIHYGVLGMKWGIRRYQNEDGTLTDAGKERVRKKYSKGARKLLKYEAAVYASNKRKNKLDEKMRKQDYEANRPKRFLESWDAYERRGARASAKLRSIANAYREIDWDSEKMYNKGAKWAEKMHKKFKGIDLSSVNQDEINYVESYINKVIEDRTRAPHNSDRRTFSITSRSHRNGR